MPTVPTHAYWPLPISTCAICLPSLPMPTKPPHAYWPNTFSFQCNMPTSAEQAYQCLPVPTNVYHCSMPSNA
eukprot:scaffold37801_cov16-Tisochrysis_lutea.AAC.1